MFRLLLIPCLCLSLGLSTLPNIQAEDKKEVLSIAEQLQASSVTVRAGPYFGSGTLVETKDGQVWVWTAGHVIANLRHTREALDDKGGKRTKVEFDDAQIQQFNKDEKEGRIVGNFSSDAQVIRYSDATFGEDLALLRLRDKKVKPAVSAKFYLDDKLPTIGGDLRHCGSLLGPVGSNSITGGLLSQHGRVFDGKIYDQTTAISFPGSSGGVVALNSDGRYVGMLVMGAGEGFGLIVPVRRMRTWAKSAGVEFALDPTKEVPKDEDLLSKPVDFSSSTGTGDNCKQRAVIGLKFMVMDERDPLAKRVTTLKDWFARPGIQWIPGDK